MEEPSFRLFRTVVRQLSGRLSDQNATQSVIDGLVFEYNVQNRTSAVVTASFSVAASLIVIFSVLYDAWRLSRKSYPKKPHRRANFLGRIRSAHVFPLAVSIGVVMQGVIFLAVASTGLRKMFSNDCKDVSQIIWPAIWIVGYIQLVFSSETAYRSLKSRHFAHRGRWNTLACSLIVVTMLILTWIPSTVRQPGTDRCPASLLHWASPWADFATVFASSLMTFYMINCAVLMFQLRHTAKLGREERIEASNVVYHLSTSVVLFAFTIPYWVQSTFSKANNVTNVMGAISLSIFGILHSFLYLILRSNEGKTVIRSGNSRSLRKSRWKIFGSSEAAQRTAAPVDLGRHGGAAHLFGSFLDEKSGSRDVESYGNTTSVNAQPREGGDPIIGKSSPTPAKPPATVLSFSRGGSSYSIFPSRDSLRHTKRFMLNVDNRGEDILLPPRPTFLGHRRFSSEISAATVQIGLRLSNVMVPLALHQAPSSSTSSLPLPSPTQQAGMSQTSLTNTVDPTPNISLGSPIELRSPSEYHQPQGISLDTTSSGSLWQMRGDTFRRLSRWMPLHKKPVSGPCINKELPPPPLRVSKRNRMPPQSPPERAPVEGTVGGHSQPQDSMSKAGKTCRQVGGWI